MVDGLRYCSLTRRRVLLGATASILTALTAACGQEPTASRVATNASPTPAPTRIVIVPTPLPTATPLPPPPSPIATPVGAVPRIFATPTGTPTMPLIVFAGGSNVRGIGVGETENFVARTVAALGPGKYDAVNLGVAQPISDWNATAALTIDPLYAPSRTKNIAVLYNSGFYDFYRGASGDEIYVGLVTMLQGRRSVGFKVVALTGLPSTEPVSGDFESVRQTVNARIRMNVATLADALADVAADPTIGTANAPNNRDYYQSGGVNLTAKGHSIVASIVTAAILTL